jgi:hypothetical protein
MHAQSAEEKFVLTQFPITLQVEKSDVDNSGISQQQLLQASVMGMAPPVFGFFAGTLNGERHWHFGCMAENTQYEQNPCADMPIGTHRARWVHNRELLEVFAYDSNGAVTLRYLDVTIDPKNPPPPDDPVQNLPASPGFFSITEKPYPLLIHVYGAVSLSLPVGELPARTNCQITAIGSTQANVDCRQYPPIPINRGTVEVQASVNGRLKSLSCEAKWHWSKCSVLMPGFYEAHWKDNSESKIVLLGQRNGKLEEVGFELRD